MWITYSKVHGALLGSRNLKELHRKCFTKPQSNDALPLQLRGANSVTKRFMKGQLPSQNQPYPVDTNKCTSILKVRYVQTPQSGDIFMLNYDSFQNAGFSSEFIRNHLNLLSYPPAFLKNCLLVCQEFACYNDKIGTSIVDFSRFINFRISILKEFNVIPSNVDVLDSILYYLNIPRSECDVEVDDFDKIQQVYWKFYYFYLKRELQIDDDDVRKLYKQDFLVSFRLLRENLYLLRKSFGFTTAELIEMPFLLRTDPENSISILRSPRAVNLKEVIFSHPRLLTVPSQHIQVVHQFLKKNKMDFNVLLNDPEVLRMDICKLIYRLAKVAYTPSLSVFKDHPRMAELLRHSGEVSERLLILKNHSMDCYDLPLLTGPSRVFLRHIVDGADRSNGIDIAIMISNKLSRPVQDVKRELDKNDGLQFVPLLTVKNNLDYLIEMGFSKDDIYRSVQILLYPRVLVENRLTDILINPVELNDAVEYQILSKKFFLPLALYYIEKEWRFAESGIWSEKGDANSESVFSGKYIAAS